MNSDYIKHLSVDHGAKIEIDSKGRQCIVTRIYQIPKGIGKLNQLIINNCWFCVLEDFEKLEKGEKKMINFELINASESEIRKTVRLLKIVGYSVLVNRDKKMKWADITVSKTLLS